MNYVEVEQYYTDMLTISDTIDGLARRVRELEPQEVPLGGAVGAHTVLDGTVHTDTVADAVTQGSLVYGNSDPAWDELVVGTQYQLLTVNAAGTEPEWASFDWDNIATAAGADMVHDHSTNAEGGEIPLASLGSWTQGDLIVGGAVDWTDLAIGALGTILYSDGSDPSWQTLAGANIAPADATYLVNSANATLTNEIVVTAIRGALIIGDAVPTWTVTAHPGGAGYALTTDANDTIWDQTPTWTGRHTFNAGIELPDTQSIGITGNELMTVYAAGYIVFDGCNVGINEPAPSELLHITSATTTKPAILIENTNTDAQAPTIDFYKNSTSPADGDDLGAIDFYGEDSAGNITRYAYILAESLDVTNTDESGGLDFQVMMDVNYRSLLELTGYNGVVNQGEVVVNQEGQDVDFYVEAVGVNDAIFIRGSDGQVTLGALGAGYVNSDAGGILSVTATATPTAHAILSAYHSDAATDAVTRGSLIYGNSTPQWDELVLGGISGSVLTRDANDVLWSTGALLFSGAFTLTIPATGTVVLGTGINTRVAFWSGVNTLSSDAQFTFSTVDNSLTVDKLNLADTSNQVVFQSAGVTGTLTWTPATLNKTVTIPDYTGTVALGAGTLTTTTANDVATATHTHAVTTTSDGNANVSTILQSSASGQLKVSDLFLPLSGQVGTGTTLITFNDAIDVFYFANGDIQITTSGKGIIHADGNTDGEFLRANGTRYVPAGFYFDGTAGQTYTFPASSSTIIDGSGAANRVAYWSGASTLTSDAGMTYNAATDSLTAGDFFTTDGGKFGISSNELLTVNATGTFAFSGISGVTVEDGDYLGITSDVRVLFDSTNGYLDAILGDAAGADEFRVLDSGGVAVHTVDSGGNGYFAGDVGVGTSPSYELDVDGTANADRYRLSTLAYAYYNTAAANIPIGSGVIEIGYAGGGTSSTFGTRVNANGTTYFQAWRNATTGYFTFIGGRVGIEVALPAYRLDIDAGAMRYAEMTAPSNPAANSLIQYAYDNGGTTELDIKFNSGNIIRLSDGSKLGLGVTTINAQCDIDQSSSTAAIPVLKLDQGDTSEQCIEFSSDSADRDINLFTIDVTGTPTMAWDESENALEWNADFYVEDRAVFGQLTLSAGRQVEIRQPTAGVGAVCLTLDNADITTGYFELQNGMGAQTGKTAQDEYYAFVNPSGNIRYFRAYAQE